MSAARLFVAEEIAGYSHFPIAVLILDGSLYDDRGGWLGVSK